MYFRFFILSSRAVMFHIGRSVHNYRVVGLGRYRPFYISWRHRTWGY